MKRRLGDRKDGWRLRKVDPFFKLIPYIMKERSDAQVFFSEEIDLEETLKFIREIRREGYKVGFLQVCISAMVRTMSQRPKVNRFVNNKRVYARNEITSTFAIKKEMSDSAEETTLKVKFDPDSTIYDVLEKINAGIEENKSLDTENNTDKFANFVSKIPGFVYGWIIGFVKLLDRINLMPRSIIDLSPFHSSIFITDLGSLGIKPVYHHIYNFGTTSLFLAFGTREKKFEHDGDDVKKTTKLTLRVVVDERIVDGYYFSQAIKLFKKIIENPNCLREKPEKVIVDDEI